MEFSGLDTEFSKGITDKLREILNNKIYKKIREALPKYPEYSVAENLLEYSFAEFDVSVIHNDLAPTKEIIQELKDITGFPRFNPLEMVIFCWLAELPGMAGL